MLSQDQQATIFEGVAENTPEGLRAAAEALMAGAPEAFVGGIPESVDGIDPDELPEQIMPWSADKLPIVNVNKPCDHVPGGIPFYNNNAGPLSAKLSFIGADLKMHKKTGLIKDNTFLSLLAAQRGGGVTPRDIYKAALETYRQQRKPITRDQLLSL